MPVRALGLVSCLLAVLSLLPPGPLAWSQQATGPSPGGLSRLTEDTLPVVCVPGQHLVLVTDASTPALALRLCNETGTGYEAISSGSGGSVSSGLQVTDTDIRSTRHELTTLTTSGPLGLHSSVCVEVGTDGVVLTLPQAATAVAGDYFLEICDEGTGSLTLAPAEGDTLNYRTDAQVVRGQGSHLLVRLMSATNWTVISTLDSLTVPSAPGAAPLAAGTLAYDTTSEALLVGLNGVASGRVPTRLCHVTGSSAHVSSVGSGSYAAHSGMTCTIPANTLQEGDVLQTCTLTTITSGVTPGAYAQQLRSGSTILSEIQAPVVPGDTPQRSATWCWWTTVLAPPGAAAATWTGVMTGQSTGFTSGSGNSTTQPVPLATTGALVWTIYDEWGNVGGTGEDTATLKAVTVIRW